ncbi:MAG: XTP/dITP diphosphatase [Nitrospirae bacterium]|nr:XTP/dITP diphosphatase [Nitrospirota bacterium]
MEIVLATRNRKKSEELQRILAGADVTVLTLNDFPDCPEVVEDKDTFEGNAIKKASEVASYTGRVAVADDSGLEVYALGNAPGVFSARYAGENADDEKNIRKLLDEMKDIEPAKRGARFVCCIAFAQPNHQTKTFLGFVEGVIGTEVRGSGGFGYDPVFYPLNSSKTFAEITPKEKDEVSHRKKALEGWGDYLKKTYFSKT